jgi:hypothetical protein
LYWYVSLSFLRWDNLAHWKDNGLGNRKIRIQFLIGTVILSPLPFYFFFNVKTRNYTIGKVKANNLILFPVLKSYS